MSRKRSALIRAVPELKLDARDIMTHRVRLGLSFPKEFSEREFTELLRKTNGYKLSLEELKTKPKIRR